MVCGNATSVCGWAELFNGNLIGASFVMYNTALLGWTVVILFLVYQFMLWMKTANLTIMWVTGVLFASLYVASSFVMEDAVWVLFTILVLELGAILYFLVFR